MKKEETFLESRPKRDDFNHLLADKILTEARDKKRINILKEVFLTAAKNYNDEAAKESLKLIKKAYQAMSRKFNDSLMTEFNNYLMGIYWQLPDVEFRHEGHQLTLFQTKSWILEKVISGWYVESYPTRKITETSIRAFRFLIAAFDPAKKENWPGRRPGESEFELKARGRKVSKEERDKILELIRGFDTRFTPEELEFWLNQPYLPYEFEKTLAIARTRNGGRDFPRKKCIWREDIRNAQLLKPFSPDERTEAAINFFLCFGDVIANMDRKVQELLEQMKASGRGSSEEIGGSEYVLGQIKIDNYYTLFKIMIKVKVEPEHPEVLVQDNFGRTKRHAEKWLQENPSHRIILNMSGGETDIQLSETFSGNSYKD